MPNYVTNQLTVSGTKADAVIKSLKIEDEYGDFSIDFNNIVPMPDSLKIISGTITANCVELYLTSMNPSVDYYGAKVKFKEKRFNTILETLNKAGHGYLCKQFNSALSLDKIAEIERDAERNKNSPDKEHKKLNSIKKLIDYGRKAVNNVLKYGAMDWYDWSIANWGTKWNACHCYFNDANTFVEFDTAWSNVGDLICKLSKMFPKNTFEYKYAEEDTGAQTGREIIKNGEVIEHDYPDDFSKEAYEIAFDIFGGEESYIFDEKKGTYVFDDYEKEKDGEPQSDNKGEMQ